MTNDMRTLLKKMRDANKGVYTKVDNTKNESKNLTMRDMLGKMRKLNELRDVPNILMGGADILTGNGSNSDGTTTELDLKKEEDKMQRYFNDLNVHVGYKYLDNDPDTKSVFAAGQINDEIQFYFIVTPNAEDNEVEIETLDSFDDKNEDNQKIIDRIKAYYNIFYKYWEDNVLS